MKGKTDEELKKVLITLDGKGKKIKEQVLEELLKRAKNEE